jgi:hypothetical protein
MASIVHVALFAATYPERTAALVLQTPMVRGAWAPDYPWGARDEDEFEPFLSTPEDVVETIRGEPAGPGAGQAVR